MPTAFMTGDINLMNVDDPLVPFHRVRDWLAGADVRFSNLECCLHLPEHGHTLEHEGFFADPEIAAAALKEAGIDVVGIANNVNYGEANIVGSMANLRRHQIPFAGAGMNIAEARKPVIIERAGVRYGFLQRSSIYWSTNHEAGESGVGIATIRGHTAYHVPMYREGSKTPPFNRPGIPPLIVTWADKDYLGRFADDIAKLRAEVDVLIASCHWGLRGDVLEYMDDIARTAIDAGADVIMGHGPHQPLPVGIYKSKPIFYGLGSFSFHTGHLGTKAGDWLGLVVRMAGDGKGEPLRFSLRFVRHSDENETVLCDATQEREAIDRLSAASQAHGASLSLLGEDIHIHPVEAARS